MCLWIELRIQLITIKLARNQWENEGSVSDGLERVPSTKPSLFFAAKEINIDCFHELNPIPLNWVEIKIELGLSEEAMKYGLEESIEFDARLCGTDEDMIQRIE